MSGGTAYVYDPEKVFREVRCNKDGLDLELLFEREDLGILESLIRRHVEFTGSPLGKRLLANWGETVKGFVKVIPQEYKRILEKRKAAGKSTTSSSTVQAKKDLAIAEAAH